MGSPRLEALVERHRDVVFRVAARIVGPGDAEDISQDAFLRAFHRLNSFRGEGSSRAWLLQITHHAAVNAPARRREVADTEAVEAAEELESSATRLPAERLEERERRERLDSKLTGLPPAHRAVLVLRDLEAVRGAVQAVQGICGEIVDVEAAATVLRTNLGLTVRIPNHLMVESVVELHDGLGREPSGG